MRAFDMVSARDNVKFDVHNVADVEWLCLQVQLWDVNTRVLLREYEAHERRVWSVDFNPINTNMFASGSDDGTVKVRSP
jgi:WD40 repeat protein